MPALSKLLCLFNNLYAPPKPVFEDYFVISHSKGSFPKSRIINILNIDKKYEEINGYGRSPVCGFDFRKLRNF